MSIPFTLDPTYAYPLFGLICGLGVWSMYWLSIVLCFYPQQRCKPLGLIKLHGIIPAQQEKISQYLGQSLHQSLTDLDQVFEQLSPERMAHQIEQRLKPQLDTMLDQVMLAQQLRFWESLPIGLKNQWYARMHRLMPRIIDDVIDDLSSQMLLQIPISSLINNALTQQPNLLRAIFLTPILQRCKQMAAIYGIIGSLVGWGLLVLYKQYGLSWVVPFGLAALTLISSQAGFKLLFQPTQRLSGISDTITQRLDEALVSVISKRFLRVDYIFSEFFTNDREKYSHAIVQKNFNKVMDHLLLRPFVQMSTGLLGFANIKQQLAGNLVNSLQLPLQDPDFVTERAKNLEQLLQPNAQQLRTTLNTSITKLLAPSLFLFNMIAIGVGLTLGFALLHCY